MTGHSRHRAARGMRTQLVVALWYAKRLAPFGWGDADTAGGGRPGRDILNVPCSIEVKARSEFSPGAWVADARARRRTGEDPHAHKTFQTDTLPAHVVVRLNGQGDDEEAVASYLVLRRLDDDTEILQELLALRQWKAQAHCGEGCTGRDCTFCARYAEVSVADAQTG